MHKPSAPPQFRTALSLALYQPDIPQNAGTMLRMCACLGVDAAIIGPAGFPTGDRHFRRSGMDYLGHVALSRHASFDDFEEWRSAQTPSRRLVLLSTKSSANYYDSDFQVGDILMVGRESAGVPKEVADRADMAVKIPMQPGMRSLNVAVAAAIVLGEALRQTRKASNEAQATT